MEASWHRARGLVAPEGHFLAPVCSQVFSNERATCASISLSLQDPQSSLQHQEGQALGKGQTVKAGEKPRRPVEGRQVLPWTQ